MYKKGEAAINAPRPRFLIATTIPIVACFGVFAAFKTGLTQPALTVETAVVATVEGKQIPAKIYRMYLKNGMDALGLDDKTADGRQKIAQLKAAIVSELIDRALIEAEVGRRGLPVSDEQLDSAYRKTIAEMGGDSAYRAYLAEHGLTDEEFRQTTRQEVSGSVLRNELDKEVAVSEAEIASFFNNQQNNASLAEIFKQPELVTARHILIAARRSQIASEIQAGATLAKTELDRRVSDEMTKRRNRAADVLARLQRGADFARLATEYSDDQATKARGGDLGTFTRNAHTSAFDEAAFALKQGQLSDVVETEFGYHVIQVTEHQPARVRTLDEARPAIQAKLLDDKRKSHLSAWLKSRRREADIRIDPFYNSPTVETERAK